MGIIKIKKRKFTLEDNIAFAELSGDYNLLHVDAIAARRLLYGSPVVHGVYSLLWGLNSWFAEKTETIKICSIKSRFHKPIRVGEEVSLSLINEDKKHVKIDLLCGEFAMTSIEFKYEKSELHDFEYCEKRFPEKLQPQIILGNEIKTKSGTLDLCLNIEAATKIFPHLIRCISSLQIAVLLGTTRLVGMECPGLNSVYYELSLFSSDSHEGTKLKYEVTKYHRLFGLVSMEVITPNMFGVIKAFIRPTPQVQDSYLKLKEQVNVNEFSGQRALVIGGSRGLGEVTGKLLAAGGAKIKITYNQGEEDAHCIVDEIISNGGVADYFHFDVLNPQINNLQLSLNNWAPTHLYYFATPFIFSGVKGVFSTNLFNKFCDYYIMGFLNITNSLISSGLRNIFNPSSVAIDDLPLDMGEYVAAKMAGEMLCTSLEKSNSNLTIYKPRLSRMNTDQTASLFPINNPNPAPIMLEHLRRFKNT